MIHHTQCPVCHSRDIREVMIIKDSSVSGESFPVVACQHCALIFTQDTPEPDQIGPYYQSEQYVSHTDTDKGLINRLYHLVRRFTLKRKKHLICKSIGLSDGNILDVGSGTGAFLKVMKSAGWSITGVEPDATARQNAHRLHGIVSFTPDDMMTLPSENYDAITLWHVLEHVHDLEKEMQALWRLLNKDGRLFIAVPNHTAYDARYYKSYWAAWDVPRHLYHFSPGAMQYLAKQYGFVLEKIKPMWFDSYYISMLSEKYKHGRTHLMRAIWIGFLSNLKACMNKGKCSSVIYILKKN